MRSAARAVILDEDSRVLLVRFELPAKTFWATPGGGIEDEESSRQALERELVEEVGLTEPDVGPLIWTRVHHFEIAGYDGQYERYHLVRTAAFDPEPTIGWDALRAEGVTELRWWTMEELVVSTEEFAPTRFPLLYGDLIASGPPSMPLDVGV